MEILENYTLNSATMLLMPAGAIEYETIVYEEGRIFDVRQRMASIIKESCLKVGMSTYEGRLEAVKRMTNFYKKIPVLVSKDPLICLFPTHALDKYNLHYVSSRHVLQIEDYGVEKQATVLFINGERVDIPTSVNILKKQWERGAHVMELAGRSSVERMYK